MKKITVLMSTYNGEKYIKEQLDSIFDQKGVDLNLLIRDDGSTDATVEILRNYQRNHQNMNIICDGENLKPCLSFLRLVNMALETDYYALADQDDIWDDDKLCTAINMLETFPTSVPALYFSNLKIVDENDIFYRKSHERPIDISNKYSCLVEPKATGCTVVYNRALAMFVHDRMPSTFSMHDTFLFMIAAMCGNVIYDYNAHIDYRQHGSNSVGTYLKNKPVKAYIKQIQRLFDRNLQPRYENAVQIFTLYGDYFKENDPDCLEKLETIIRYKDSVCSKAKLLFDRELRPSKGGLYLIRFYILVLLNLL